MQCSNRSGSSYKHGGISPGKHLIRPIRPPRLSNKKIMSLSSRLIDGFVIAIAFEFMICPVKDNTPVVLR